MIAPVLLLVLVAVAVDARSRARDDEGDTNNAKTFLQVLCSTQTDQAALQRVQTCINAIQNERLKSQATSLLEGKDKFCQNGQLGVSLNRNDGKPEERLDDNTEEDKGNDGGDEPEEREDGNENESRWEKIKEQIKDVGEFLKQVRDFEQCVVGQRT